MEDRKRDVAGRYVIADKLDVRASRKERRKCSAAIKGRGKEPVRGWSAGVEWV